MMVDRKRQLAQTFIACAIATQFVSVTNAQQQRRMSLPSNEEMRVADGRGTPVIPFEIVNNHVILEVSVNGKATRRVILDTGMPTPGIALYDGPGIEGLDLDFDPGIRAQVGGAGGGPRLTARIALDESFAVGDVTFDHTRVIAFPSPSAVPTYHQGVVGLSLFQNFSVEIDPQVRLIRLHDPETYRAPDDADVVPLTMRRNVPYAEISFTLDDGQPKRGEVVVDLGASHAVSLNDELDSIVVPEPSLSTVLGRGVSGEVLGKVARVASLQVGSTVLLDVIASFPVEEHQNPRGLDSLAGNLGTGILRRFVTTFDYSRNRMLLVPTEGIDEPFRFDHAGIRFDYGAPLSVEHVIAGSPASEADVRVGDVLTRIDERSVDELPIDQVRAILEQPGEVTLHLRRDGRALEKRVLLRRLI